MRKITLDFSFQVFTKTQISTLFDWYSQWDNDKNVMVLMILAAIAEKHPPTLKDFFPQLCDDKLFKPESLITRSNIITCVGSVDEVRKITPDRRQSKTLIHSTHVDQKWLETVFFIAICRPTGDKWQSKTLFLAIFIHVCRLLRGYFVCRLSSMKMK